MAIEKGKVITVSGPVEPSALGRVMMHEHLHSDVYDWERQELVNQEKPIAPERRRYLLEEAVPYLKACTAHGCRAYCDTTPPPWRAWPTFYAEASAAADMHIVLCTGCYGEMNDGEYWVKKPEDKLWSFAVEASAEELAEFFTREILEGIHGTGVRAGAIKLGSRIEELKPNERKTFAAGAAAQKATGAPITTHAGPRLALAQLRFLDEAGVDLSRVVIGHTAGNLMDPELRREAMEWMRRGANFLPTNLGIGEDGGEPWRPLVEGIHECFQAGLGSHIVLGLDWAFCSESGPFGPCTFMPPPPFLHMFTHTLPALRRMGLSPAEEDAIMRTNPQRILTVS